MRSIRHRHNINYASTIDDNFLYLNSFFIHWVLLTHTQTHTKNFIWISNIKVEHYGTPSSLFSFFLSLCLLPLSGSIALAGSNENNIYARNQTVEFHLMCTRHLSLSLDSSNHSSKLVAIKNSFILMNKSICLICPKRWRRRWILVWWENGTQQKWETRKKRNPRSIHCTTPTISFDVYVCFFFHFISSEINRWCV